MIRGRSGICTEMAIHGSVLRQLHEMRLTATSDSKTNGNKMNTSMKRSRSPFCRSDIVMGSRAWLSWRLRSGREVQVQEMERLGPKSGFLAAMSSPFSKASRACDPHSRALQANPPVHRPDLLPLHFFVHVVFGYSVFHEGSAQVASSGRPGELARGSASLREG